MKRFPWVVGLVVVLATSFVAACASPDLTIDRDIYLNNAHRGNAVVEPTSYMAAVGCSVQEGARDSNTVVFRMVGGALARFHCPTGSDTAHVNSGIRAYRDAVFASTGHMLAGAGGGGGYDVYQYTYYECTIEGHTVYAGDTDQILYTYFAGSCEYWEIYQHYGDGDNPSPNAGGSGSIYVPLPKPTPPTNPTVPVCADSSGDAQATDSVSYFNQLAAEDLLDQLQGREVCTGPTVLTCMQSHPGVWLGRVPLAVMGELAGHTAINLSDPSHVPPTQISELIGGIPLVAGNSVVIGDDHAHINGGETNYKWIRVGETSQFDMINSSIQIAKNEYLGLPYTLGSNRFMSTILQDSGIHLTRDQVASLGPAPGLCWCGVCGGS